MAQMNTLKIKYMCISTTQLQQLSAASRGHYHYFGILYGSRLKKSRSFGNFFCKCIKIRLSTPSVTATAAEKKCSSASRVKAEFRLVK